MIVVDRDEVWRHERADVRVVRRTRIAHLPRGDAVERIDAGRADAYLDFGGVVEDPVEQIVVIPDGRRQADDQFDVRTALVGPVDRFVVSPDWIAAAPLEDAHGVRGRVWLALVGRE